MSKTGLNHDRPLKVFVSINDAAPEGYVITGVDESTLTAVAVRSDQTFDCAVNGECANGSIYSGLHNQGLRPRNFG
jgi:hypothetical protein